MQFPNLITEKAAGSDFAAAVAPLSQTDATDLAYYIRPFFVKEIKATGDEVLLTTLPLKTVKANIYRYMAEWLAIDKAENTLYNAGIGGGRNER